MAEKECLKCIHHPVCKTAESCDGYVSGCEHFKEGWISVKDRLPDRNDMVIAFYPTMCGTSGEMQIHKAWAMSDTCTHWMPLPQPPKGE